MAAKVTYKYTVSGGKKSDVLEFVAGLQELPQHKWIPAEEMSESNRATMTPRQAGWLEAQVGKRVEGRTIVFDAVLEPAEA